MSFNVMIMFYNKMLKIKTQSYFLKDVGKAVTGSCFVIIYLTNTCVYIYNIAQSFGKAMP